MRSGVAVSNLPDRDPPGLPLPLTGRTSLFAILGDPIDQVGSPTLINTAFRRRGWPAVLVPLHVKAPDLAVALKGLRSMANLRGVMLTAPHKTRGLGFVDSIGPEARLVRSINAIHCGKDGRWHGENFDGLGCLQGLRTAGHEVEQKRVLVIGTGGAGRAVAAAVARAKPAELCLYDVDQERAGAVRQDLSAAFPDVSVTVGPPDPETFEIMINCTPVGMAGSCGSPVDPSRLAPGTLVVDLVIEPELTYLLQAAAARGCIVQPGLFTLAGQVDALCAFFDGGDNV